MSTGRWGKLGQLHQTSVETQFTKDQLALVEHCRQHPWNKLTAEYHDPEYRHNRPLVWTRDEENPDRSQRVRPFPKNLPHVKALVDLMFDPPRTFDGKYTTIVVPKARRSIVSYTVCSFASWEWETQLASNWMMCKHDKADAQRLMHEKIYATYEMMPDFWKRAFPCKFAGGDAGYQSPNGGLIVPAESGFHTGSGLGVAQSYFFDEAPLMKKLRTAYEKIRPTAALLVLAGTPPGFEDDFDPESLEFFTSFFEKVTVLDGDDEDDEGEQPVEAGLPPEIRTDQPAWSVSGVGFRGWLNENGHAILRIDWRALHGDDWRQAQIRGLGGADGGGLEAFNREYDLDFTTRAGKPFYTAFALHPERHDFRIKRREDGSPMLGPTPLLCGWDFGATAALEVGQFSKDFGGGTLAFIHELTWWRKEEQAMWAGQLDAWNIRDLARFLLGLIPLDELHKQGRAGSLAWLERSGVKEPWFQYPNAHVQRYGIRHFCGHESRNSTALAHTEERTWQQVWESVGMYVPGASVDKSDRYTAMRTLMGVSPESRLPRLLVSSKGCPVLFKALAGGLKHARKGAKAKRGEPDEASPFNHVHDAGSYVPVGIEAMNLVTQQQQQPVLERESDGQPHVVTQLEGPSLPWAEVTVPWDERPI